MPKRYDSQMIGACLAATERNLNSCGRHSATDGHDINPARFGSNNNLNFTPNALHSANFAPNSLQFSANTFQNVADLPPLSSRLVSAGSTLPPEPSSRAHKLQIIQYFLIFISYSI